MFKIFQHLLPRARAWYLTAVNKNLRKFFEGLSPFGDAIRLFINQIFQDIDPALTRELDTWEKQFGLLPSDQSTAIRRSRLSAAWRRFDGQDPSGIQATLQAAGFTVFVHEWWQPGFPPAVPRDPTAILNSSGVIYVGECGEAIAECGEVTVECGNLAQNLGGYVLVNNAPGSIFAVPSDPTLWPYFLYIGAATFPTLASIPLDRQAEFETLVLKITPAQQWVGVLVSFP